MRKMAAAGHPARICDTVPLLDTTSNQPTSHDSHAYHPAIQCCPGSGNDGRGLPVSTRQDNQDRHCLLYGLTTCDTCKKVRKWLQQADIAHVFVDVRNAPVPPLTLSQWADRRGGFAALVNKSSTTWRQLPEARKTPADDAGWLALLREFPALLRRPIVVMDDGRVHQGFSAAAFSTLFGVSA